MGRTPCCSKEQGLNRGAWTAMEDRILTDYINAHGQGKWRNIPTKAGLNRCGKSCRLRWLNYLRPDIKRGNITDDEEELIIRLHKLLGNRWSLIAGRLPGRTDNEIKNYWNTIIGKKISNQPSPSPPPVRRSSSFPAAHDHPIPDVPIIKRSYSFTAQDPPPRTDYNATGPSQINEVALTKERFSHSAVSDGTRNIPAVPENLDIDSDFISDILNAAELAHLNSDQPLSFDHFQSYDHLDWLINF